MTKFMIGCDPEIFLKKNGVAFSAHGVIPGNKSTPHPVIGGAVQVDGMATELNITPVTLREPNSDPTPHAFNAHVQAVTNELKKLVKAHDPELDLHIASVMEFDEAVIEAQPKEARELGCNPDFNAYTMEENPMPDGDAVNFRTSGGHIHIGWDTDIPVEHPEHFEICANFIKYMDATVGMFMTLLDADPRRRVLYGKAGAFRPKSYGVEYRTPSALWVETAEYQSMIFKLSQMAVIAATNEYRCAEFTAVASFEEIRTIIDEGDYEKALQVLNVLVKTFYVDDRQGWQNTISRVYRTRRELEGKPIPIKPKKPAKPKATDYYVKTADNTVVAAANLLDPVHVEF